MRGRGFPLHLKIRMFICSVFGHFEDEKRTYTYNGEHSHCKCCSLVIMKQAGKWVL